MGYFPFPSIHRHSLCHSHHLAKHTTRQPPSQSHLLYNKNKPHALRFKFSTSIHGRCKRTPVTSVVFPVTDPVTDSVTDRARALPSKNPLYFTNGNFDGSSYLFLHTHGIIQAWRSRHAIHDFLTLNPGQTRGCQTTRA